MDADRGKERASSCGRPVYRGCLHMPLCPVHADPTPQDLVAQLDYVLHGSTWAHTDPPYVVWGNLLHEVKRLQEEDTDGR